VAHFAATDVALLRRWIQGTLDPAAERSVVAKYDGGWCSSASKIVMWGVDLRSEWTGVEASPTREYWEATQAAFPQAVKFGLTVIVVYVIGAGARMEQGFVALKDPMWMLRGPCAQQGFGVCR